MPRTALTLLEPSDVGQVLNWANLDPAGSIVPPDCVVFYSNGSGSAYTITVETPAGAGVPSGLNLSDRSLVIPAGGAAAIGPFPQTFYARQTTPDAGKVYINYSGVTSMVAIAVRVPSRLPT